MAIENETADQVVRMVLQGSEVVLRLSGEAGMRIATMIYNFKGRFNDKRQSDALGISVIRKRSEALHDTG